MVLIGVTGFLAHMTHNLKLLWLHLNAFVLLFSRDSGAVCCSHKLDLANITEVLFTVWDKLELTVLHPFQKYPDNDLKTPEGPFVKLKSFSIKNRMKHQTVLLSFFVKKEDLQVMKHNKHTLTSWTKEPISLQWNLYKYFVVAYCCLSCLGWHRLACIKMKWMKLISCYTLTCQVLTGRGTLPQVCVVLVRQVW